MQLLYAAVVLNVLLIYFYYVTNIFLSFLSKLYEFTKLQCFDYHHPEYATTNCSEQTVALLQGLAVLLSVSEKFVTVSQKILCYVFETYIAISHVQCH